ncbi:MAG: class I SAM-dependent methyltransferase [Methanosarcinales archaeon]|nr:class I SAM-dependent methyltransferase [Methanosarcinales archaeon]
MEESTAHSPLWHYDERRQIGTDYSSQQEIEAYDLRMQQIRDVPSEIREVLDLLDLQPDHTLLELGCGTAEFSLAAAGHCSRVIAADISGPMLEYARNKAQARGVQNVEFVQAGFLTYRHQGRPLEAVVSQLALHHLPDFWKQVALNRIFDMLKEGGQFYLRDVVYSFPVRNYGQFFQEFLNSMSREGQPPQDIVRHIRDEYSTQHWVLEGMMARAGFLIDQVDHKNGFIATYHCTRV